MQRWDLCVSASLSLSLSLSYVTVDLIIYFLGGIKKDQDAMGGGEKLKGRDRQRVKVIKEGTKKGKEKEREREREREREEGKVKQRCMMTHMMRSEES